MAISSSSRSARASACGSCSKLEFCPGRALPSALPIFLNWRWSTAGHIISKRTFSDSHRMEESISALQICGRCRTSLMKRLWPSILLLIIVSLQSPACLRAQRNGSTEIDVQVRNQDGTAGPRGIHVRLESAEGGSAGDCVTEQGGRCHFVPGASGMYIVRVNQLGYKEVAVHVNLADTSRGFVTIDLKPAPG